MIIERYLIALEFPLHLAVPFSFTILALVSLPDQEEITRKSMGERRREWKNIKPELKEHD